MGHQLYKNIVSDADICNEKPTIKNTRITVQSVMCFILAGDSDEDVLQAFPKLTVKTLQECKHFASEGF